MTWTTRPRCKRGPQAAIVAGEGPRILLLHGVGLRAEAWGPQIDALRASGFSVIAPDMPGHGASPTAQRDMCLQDYSGRAALWLDEPTVVVGHSMGAMIALDLAARHPDRLLGVVALNAIFRRSVTARKAVAARVAALDGRNVADPSDTLVRWFGHEPSPERNACESWLRGCDPAGYKAAYSVFAQEDGPAVETLAGLHIPALFLTGSEEANSTPHMSRSMAAFVPDGRAGVIDGAAHMMPMTHADAVNRRLESFARGCQP